MNRMTGTLTCLDQARQSSSYGIFKVTTNQLLEGTKTVGPLVVSESQYATASTLPTMCKACELIMVQTAGEGVPDEEDWYSTKGKYPVSLFSCFKCLRTMMVIIRPDPREGCEECGVQE